MKKGSIDNLKSVVDHFNVAAMEADIKRQLHHATDIDIGDTPALLTYGDASMIDDLMHEVETGEISASMCIQFNYPYLLLFII